MVILTDIFLKYYIIKSQYFNFEKLYPIHGYYILITTRSKSKLTSCICIHGVQYNENDDINVINKVGRCCDEICVKSDMNEIDRVHYIGKPVSDTDSKQKVRSIIVKFKSWESETAFHKARPTNFINGRKKPGAKSLSVSLDLTKRR